MNQTESDPNESDPTHPDEPDPAEPFEAAQREALRRTAAGTACVLFDFDGPICHLFANHPAPGVARRLRETVARCHPRPLPATEVDDPHEVLRAVAAPDARAPRNLVALVESELTKEEIEAAATAPPTEHARELADELAGRQVALAVTTNNAPDAAWHFLDAGQLHQPFGEHVYGRDPRHPELMKPDPHCLNRAMRALGQEPDSCLMVGDSLSDLKASANAGVVFVGYARNAHRARVLRAAGAELVVGSLGELREAFAAAR